MVLSHIQVFIVISLVEYPVLRDVRVLEIVQINHTNYGHDKNESLLGQRQECSPQGPVLVLSSVVDRDRLPKRISFLQKIPNRFHI